MSSTQNAFNNSYIVDDKYHDISRVLHNNNSLKSSDNDMSIDDDWNIESNDAFTQSLSPVPTVQLTATQRVPTVQLTATQRVPTVQLTATQKDQIIPVRQPIPRTTHGIFPVVHSQWIQNQQRYETPSEDRRLLQEVSTLSSFDEKQDRINYQTKLLENIDLVHLLNIMQNSNDITLRRASQSVVEYRLISENSCKDIYPGIYEEARVRLFSLEKNSLRNSLLKENLFSSEAQTNISCIVDAIIYESDRLLSVDRIRNWFTNVRQIGQKSLEGYALADDSELFILKTPRRVTNDYLTHETLVGFYGLNPIRNLVSNFMYIYGYTNCSGTTMRNITNKPITWCASKTPKLSYMIAENISNSVPIGDFCLNPNITTSNFLNVFALILNALNVANAKCSFTHYDLHYNNVLVKDYQQLVAIPFYNVVDSDNITIKGYIVTRYVPYIIDYGFSTITIDGVRFGKLGYESANVSNQPFPMFDVYKLVGFLGKVTNKNDAFRQLTDGLFNFFNLPQPLSERVNHNLNNKIKDYFNAPEQYKIYSHNDYINWFLSNYNIDLPDNPILLSNNGIIVPDFGRNIDMNRFFNFVTNVNRPINALEFCDAIHAINNHTYLTPNIKSHYLRILNTNFDSVQYYLKNQPKLNNDYNLVRELITDSNLQPIDNNTLVNGPFLTIFRNKLFNLLRLKNLYANISSFSRSVRCAMSIQHKLKNYLSDLNMLDTLTKEIEYHIKTQKLIIDDTERNIEVNKKFINNTLSKNNKIFLFNELPGMNASL